MKPSRREVLLGAGGVAGLVGAASLARYGARTKDSNGRSAGADESTGTDESTEETTASEETTDPEETTVTEAQAETEDELPEELAVFPFDDDESIREFTHVDARRNVEIADRGIVEGSNSLRVTFREGGHYGTSLRYQFADAGYVEPVKLHVRYFLRLGEQLEVMQGAKLPGPAGRYGEAGWGGRRSDGTNGWSARMFFYATYDSENPIQLAYYLYHAEMDSPFGDVREWDPSGPGRVKTGRWYQIDNYLRLNTPGRDDGLLEGWVDGELAFRQDDLRFRDVARLQIQEYWLDCYWGGSWRSPKTNHVYFDHLTLFSERQEPEPWEGTETGMTERPEPTTEETETQPGTRTSDEAETRRELETTHETEASDSDETTSDPES
jgi:hypothetical protein